MPYADADKQKEAQRRYYHRNSTRIKEASRLARIERERFVLEQKRQPCVDCNHIYHPAIMHFHHRDSSTKDLTIMKMIRSRSLQALKDEIAKCDLVCANCHGLRHVAAGEWGISQAYT